MSNQYKNKVIYNGTTLIDLSTDDVAANKVLSSVTKVHLKTGEVVAGTCTYDADTSDADAVAAELLSTKTAYVNGSKVTGSMPNRGSVSGSIATKTGTYTIPQGYHDGSGSVAIDSTEQTKLVATNIRQGITLLGVEGSMTGTEDVNAETRTVTPSATSQTITPDTGYNYLSQVTVNAIPYAETDNAAGGVTVTIG